ncbi:MAG: hypothetical protein ACK5U6_05205 [Pseudanabaena sp.]
MGVSTFTVATACRKNTPFPEN